MTKQAFQEIEAFMLSCMQDAAHDREHVYRVLYQALQLAQKEENVNMDVLICACLLHDICRPDQLADPTICHARAGAEKAKAFLLAHGYAESFADHVAACIRTHRFRKSDPPESIEAKLLFDADKLDVTGAVGIARTLIYNGAVGRSMYSINPDGTISDGTDDEVDSFFREYRFKLEKIYDRFYTQAAAEIAKKRQHAAAAFAASLLAEVSEPRQTGMEVLAGCLQDDKGTDVL